MSDFDRIGAVFLKNIYATTKGRIRLAVLQRDLAPLLAGAPLRILDVGGGAGQMALWYASLGHEVVVADRSQVLLDEGRAAAQTLGLAVDFVHADAFQLADALNDATFDLVCCHAVLEWIEDGAALLAACAARVRAGGHFSLMYYNRRALVFAQHAISTTLTAACVPTAKRRSSPPITRANRKASPPGSTIWDSRACAAPPSAVFMTT